MTLKRNILIFLALAVLLGVAAAWLAQNWAQQRMAVAQEEAASKVVQVVVAAGDIQFGRQIEAAQLKLVDWPQDAVPPGAYHQIDAVEGMQSKYHILQGEPVLEARIADPQKSPLLAGLIEPNKRAVTVRVDDVVGVAGFLLPGSRVDVVASRRLEHGEAFDTRIVLHDLKVLAVDQTATAGGEDKPVVVRAVTLEVDPKQAEVLVQATREGGVQLALRNPDDRSIPEVAEKEKPAPKPAAAPRAARSSRMTVIRGTQVD